MKAIINCSAIKKVFLVDEYNTIELRMEFFDEEKTNIIKRQTFSTSSEKERLRHPIDKAYSSIKNALFSDAKYIEIVL